MRMASFISSCLHLFTISAQNIIINSSIQPLALQNHSTKPFCSTKQMPTKPFNSNLFFNTWPIFRSLAANNEKSCLSLSVKKKKDDNYQKTSTLMKWINTAHNNRLLWNQCCAWHITCGWLCCQPVFSECTHKNEVTILEKLTHHCEE